MGTLGTPEIVWSCIALVISIASFVVAAYFYKWVKQLPVANARLEEVGKLIRDGAFTFLKREYRILGLFAAVVMVLIILFFPEPIWHGNAGKNITMAIVYLFGTALSALLGRVWVKYVKPWLSQRDLTDAAKIVVEAVEALLGRYCGEDKWKLALEKMAERGFYTDSQQVIDALKK